MNEALRIELKAKAIQGIADVGDYLLQCENIDRELFKAWKMISEWVLKK